MIRTVFFDLGNVLFFFDHAKMYREVSECTGLTAEEIKKILLQEKILEYYETGQIDTSHFHQIFKSRAKKEFSLSDFLFAASDIFMPNSSLFPVVEKLKQKGVRLLLLSNTSECHFEHLSLRHPILKLFHDAVLSYKVGARKPSETIFLKALSMAQTSPNHCFYTDDVPEFIAGAKKVGLDGSVFTGVAPLKNAFAIRGLDI